MGQEKTALIVCNGVPPTKELIRQLWQKVDLKICADGGANHVISQGFQPDVVVGDMDSILPEIRQQLAPERLIQIADQITNDGDKALRYCLMRQIQKVYVLGAAGSRSDHFLANIELLYKYGSHLKIILWTGCEQIEVIDGEWQGIFPPGTTLSLHPLFGAVHGITTSGLAWPLKKQTLQMGKDPMGVSNKTTKPTVHISMEEGKLLLITQNFCC